MTYSANQILHYVPQTLTWSEVCENARKFYEEGRLGFQRNKDTCRYSYDSEGDCRCVIGASLTDNTIRRIESEDAQKVNIHNLHGLKIIAIEDKTDLEQMSRLQMLHDNLCQGEASLSAGRLVEFKKTIGIDV